MPDHTTFSSLAVLYELSSREFRKKLDLFPEELRYYVVLANSIIGTENAGRVAGTPTEVIEDGREFTAKLLGMMNPDKDGTFREVLETYLVEAMRDELRACCPNCLGFHGCIGLGDLSVGALFKRRVNGEETDELKREIARQVEEALHRTPYVDTDRAHILCGKFRHQYNAANIGGVFGRYSEIAQELQGAFGIDYRKVQREMIGLNMEFCRAGDAGNGEASRQGDPPLDTACGTGTLKSVEDPGK